MEHRAARPLAIPDKANTLSFLAAFYCGEMKIKLPEPPPPGLPCVMLDAWCFLMLDTYWVLTRHGGPPNGFPNNRTISLSTTIQRTVRLAKAETMWMRLAPTSLRFGMRLNNEYSKAHAKGQLPNLSLTLRNLYLKFAALVQSSTPPTIFWNGRFRSYPQWMRNGPCSSSIESPRVKVHVDMPNFAIGHYDPSILSAKDDVSYRH